LAVSGLAASEVVISDLAGSVLLASILATSASAESTGGVALSAATGVGVAVPRPKRALIREVSFKDSLIGSGPSAAHFIER
jgi:hypothetical protein